MSVTQNVSNKRGRPPKFSGLELSFAQSAFPNTTTKRGIQNAIYSNRALAVFWRPENDGKYRHIVCDIAEARCGSGVIHWVLMSEIGRLSADDMLLVANEICSRQLPIKDAVDYVKRYRNGSKLKEFNQFDLASAVLRAIDHYATTHHMSDDQLSITMQSILEIVSENAIGKRGGE